MDPAGLRKLEEEVKALRAVQKQIQEVAGQRETLMTQKTENELVMKELELVKGERPVYKLVGPVLVKQDLDEAKDTITKRLEYIAKQMADREARLQALSIQAAAHQKIVCSCTHTLPCRLRTLLSHALLCPQIRDMQAELTRGAQKQ